MEAMKGTTGGHMVEGHQLLNYITHRGTSQPV
jgi:hypothetical protein